MKVAIIGSGIAGLTTAFQLSRHAHAELTVFEQDEQFGGRANVTEDGEHCPRFFMDDYTRLFDVLRQIECTDGGTTVFGELRTVRRLSRAGTGWTEISHLYRFLAKEVPLRDKVRAVLAWRPSPLVAERGLHENRYGSLRNYSPASLLRLLGSILESKTGYVLPGPTDRHLIDPWVRHLRANGVELRAGTRITRIEPEPGAIVLTGSQDQELFDAVVVTAFVPELVTLLNASRLDHTIVEVDHMHCVAHTVELHPDEVVLASSQPTFYSHNGINVLVQPERARCVVLCTLTSRTDTPYVLDQVRDFLELKHEFRAVLRRSNQRPGEAVYSADYLRPGRILRRPAPGVYFAGSAIRNTYPVDSAEGAVRSALAAVQQVRCDFGLLVPAPAEICSMTDNTGWGRDR